MFGHAGVSGSEWLSMSEVTDFRIEVGYLGNGKTRMLKASLGAEAVLCHIALIEYCAINHPDGVIRGKSQRFIEVAAGWSGEPGAFFAAITHEDSRFLDEVEGGGFKMHDWEQHQPWVAGSKGRSDAARYAAEMRWAKKNGKSAILASCDAHADGIAECVFSQCPDSDSESGTESGSRADSDSRSAQGAPLAPGASARQFVPPTVDQLRAYLDTLSPPAGSLAQQMFDYHSMYNWVGPGNRKMKDWKAAARTWVSKNKEFSNGRSGRGDGSGCRPGASSDAADYLNVFGGR